MLITPVKKAKRKLSYHWQPEKKSFFIINCHDAKEVRFPEKEAVELQKELSAEGNVTGDHDNGL